MGKTLSLVVAQSRQHIARTLLALAGLLVLGVLVWQGMTEAGTPDPTASHLSPTAAMLNTGILVLREGLEVNAPALDIQAATGLLAIGVLLVIMNWFFHKIYWAGWISLHNKRRRNLMQHAGADRSRTVIGLALLGFSAMYREGFEVVLFLQSIRLQVGSMVVLAGVGAGLFFVAIIGILTFVAHRKLPYKKMLILTGIMLGVVLVVMVGESIQEMQQAHWISTTTLPLPIPDWMGVWFAVFPNIESLLAQALAALFVVGSYYIAQYVRVWRPRRRGETSAHRPESVPISAG